MVIKLAESPGTKWDPGGLNSLCWNNTHKDPHIQSYLSSGRIIEDIHNYTYIYIYIKIWIHEYTNIHNLMCIYILSWSPHCEWQHPSLFLRRPHLIMLIAKADRLARCHLSGFFEFPGVTRKNVFVSSCLRTGNGQNDVISWVILMENDGNMV
jgi:hypothetical protein